MKDFVGTCFLFVLAGITVVGLWNLFGWWLLLPPALFLIWAIGQE